MENKKQIYEDFYNNIKQAKIEPKKNNKNKKLFYSIASFLLLGGIGTSYLVWNHQNSNYKIEKTEKVAKQEVIEKASAESKPQIIETDLTLEDWMKKSYLNQTEDDKKAMLKYSSENFIGFNTEIYPSKEEGFTSDPTKEFDEDGLPNIYYVDLTREELLEQLSNIVYRISNPVYGDWISYQKPTEKKLNEVVSVELLKDIATGEFSDTVYNSGNQELFLLDYNKNNYEGRFTEESKFIGVVKDGEVIYNDDSTIKAIFTVDYKINDSQIYKTKTITLDLIIENKKLLINGGISSD